MEEIEDTRCLTVIEILLSLHGGKPTADQQVVFILAIMTPNNFEYNGYC